MKNARFKIAALVGGSVMLTLLIILVLLQVINRKEMQRRAEDAIRSCLDGEVTEGVIQYYPETIDMPYGITGSPGANQYYSAQELKIIEWCRSNKPSGVEKATIDSRTLYIGTGEINISEMTANALSVIDESEESIVYSVLESANLPLDEYPNYSMIAFVDVTPELATMRRMGIIFLIAAIIIGVLGSIEGYLVGRRLERSSKAEKLFFENTSHELKTPLTSIRGYAEGIEKGVITDYTKTGRVISRETEKMSRLIEEILLAAKLESGSMPLHKESISLDELVEECLMPMEGVVKSRELDVELSLSPTRITADPDRMEHAISNLLTNAVKYARTRLSIRLENGTLSIQNDCDALTDEELAHLFDRFYTGSNGNTGIGLSLAKEIIELHGGKIRAERTDNGIRFISSFGEVTQ